MQKRLIAALAQFAASFGTSVVVDAVAQREYGELPSTIRLALRVVETVGLEYAAVIIERVVGDDAENVKEFIQDFSQEPFIEHED